MQGMVGRTGVRIVFFDFLEMPPGNEPNRGGFDLRRVRFCRIEATLFLQFGECGERAVKAAFGRGHGALH